MGEIERNQDEWDLRRGEEDVKSIWICGSEAANGREGEWILQLPEGQKSRENLVVTNP